MKEELTLEEQVERVRRKRRRYGNHEQLRNILNSLFMLLAAIGVVWYFADENNRIGALCVLGVAMLLKIAEFIVRFFF